MNRLSILLIAALGIGALVISGAVLWPRTPDVVSEGVAVDGPFCRQTDTIERYVCLIDTAAKGAAAGPNAERLYPYFVTLTAVQTIQTIANSARYSYFANQPGFEVPLDNDICLDRGYGICGNHMLLFTHLVNALGVPVQQREFYYTDGNGNRASHAAAAVHIDGKWRFVDITWGTVWLSDPNDVTTMLALREIRAGMGTPLTQQLSPWYFSRRLLGVDFYEYLKPEADVVRQGKGLIHLPMLAREDGSFVVDWANVPNYVGDKAPGTLDRRLAAEIETPFTGTLLASAKLWGKCSDSELIVAGRAVDLSDDIAVPVERGPVRIEVRGGDDHCYANFSSLSVVPHS